MVGISFLSGCTSFHQAVDDIFLKDDAITVSSDNLSNVSGVPAPVGSPTGGVIPSVNGSVIPLPLGGPPSIIGGVNMPAFQGGMITNDPSVTVFPLDGGAPMPQYGGQMPLSQNGMSNIGIGGDFGGSSMTASGGNNIFFRDGSSRLGSGDLRKLSQIAEQAKFAPVSRITVEGFASRPTQAGTNSPTAHTLNLKESANRSVAVSKQLIKNGVPAEKIKTVSWGATKASGNDTQDRRVDIIMGER